MEVKLRMLDFVLNCTPIAISGMSEVYYLCQGGYIMVIVHLFVSLSVSNFAQKLPNGFAWNFQGRLAMGQWTNDWILVVVRITVWIQGLFFQICHYWEIWKVHPVIHLSWSATWRQRLLLSWKIPKDSPDGGTDIAVLVRRALAEVCTVPVLLVFVMHLSLFSFEILLLRRRYLCCFHLLFIWLTFDLATTLTWWAHWNCMIRTFLRQIHCCYSKNAVRAFKEFIPEIPTTKSSVLHVFAVQSKSWHKVS